MKLNKNQLIDEARNLIKIGNELITYGKSNRGYAQDEQVQKFSFWTNMTGEFINRIKDKKSHQSMAFESFRLKTNTSNIHTGNYGKIVEINGVLESIVYELENNLLYQIKKVLQADIFSDFLEMAEHLLKEGYKDASAVIIGSVLEDTLRKLCELNGIETVNEKGKHLTIDPMNMALVKTDVYNKLIQKQITSWADLRNNAAHGNFDKYDIKQVEMMLLFVQNFCSEHLK